MIYHIRQVPVFLFFLILSVISCVEPITPRLNEDDSESILVVDAQITNEVGPFMVKLTTSVPVNVMYYPQPVLNADVSIRDDHGNIYELTGDKQGKYETAEKNLKAVPGFTYTLEIMTREGDRYESAPVTMMESPEIDSLYLKEVKHVRFEEGAANEETWLEIRLDAHDPLGIAKYWNFEFTETWEVKVLTDHVRVEHSPPGTPSNPSWERISADDKKLTCWVTKNSASILVASTSNNPVDELKGFRIASLGPGEDRLHIRYSILVRQSCLSREQYVYWKQLMDANENVGGIYGKIPARVNGNIIATNGGVNPLGNFSALCVKIKRLFIGKYDHHVETKSAYQDCSYYDFAQLPWIPKSYLGTIVGTDTEVYCNSDFCADCQAYGTNIKPDFWK